MFKINNKNTGNVVLVFLLILNTSTPFFSVSIVDFDQENFSWVGRSINKMVKHVKKLSSFVARFLPCARPFCRHYRLTIPLLTNQEKDSNIIRH